MSSIKKYKSFLESSDEKLWAGIQHEYSIYEWFEDLKRFQWSKDQSSKVSDKSIEFWCNHFIGDGWFNKISNHVDKILNALEKVDTEYVNDRMYDVYDEFAQHKTKWTMCCVLYGDVDRYNNTNRSKFNGMMSAKYPKDSYWDTIIHIIKEIVSPTLSIGGLRESTPLRLGRDEVFVTDKRYQCQNFDIKNHIIYSSPSRGISEYRFKEKEKYNINLFLDMYQPGIVINIGGYGGDYENSTFNLKDLENKMDETLPSILHDLDYKEVIFDHSRYTRRFDDNADFHEYTLKILLKI